MLRVFIGYDHRQPVSYSTLCHSIIKHCTKPVSITPLVLQTLPVQRQGLTPFTFSRFLVPWLCGYEGLALFLDIDIMLRGDLAELFALADDKSAVYVSKSKLRYEWASVMLFDCAKCKMLTPEHVERGEDLHTIGWTKHIGELPGAWNHLVGYDTPNPNAKLVHFTQGVPLFPETAGSEHGAEWRYMAEEAASSVPWETLMGRSVHAAPVRERMKARA